MSTNGNPQKNSWVRNEFDRNASEKEIDVHRLETILTLTRVKFYGKKNLLRFFPKIFTP